MLSFLLLICLLSVNLQVSNHWNQSRRRKVFIPTLSRQTMMVGEVLSVQGEGMEDRGSFRELGEFKQQFHYFCLWCFRKWRRDSLIRALCWPCIDLLKEHVTWPHQELLRVQQPLSLLPSETSHSPDFHPASLALFSVSARWSSSLDLKILEWSTALPLALFTYISLPEGSHLVP